MNATLESFRWSRLFLDATVLARLAAVPLVARRAMQGNVSGRHASPHRGASVEFAEYRNYVPGDDLRRVDWRAFGRTERYYVKEFEADTNLRCCLVLDTSGSMGFRGDGPAKIDYARRIAGTLSYLAVQQGDAAGLACVADRLMTEIPPRRNPAHLSTIFKVLEKSTAAGPTRLVPTLHQLAESLRQRALVVVISDFFVELDGLRECLQHLRFRKHDVTVFQLLDPVELNFEFKRPTRFLDMEGGTAIFADPNEIASRYQIAIQGFQSSLKRMLLETGIEYQGVDTTENYDQVLMRFLVARHQRQGAR